MTDDLKTPIAGAGDRRSPAPLFGTIEGDERVTAFIGYCPHCPHHEGIPAHQRLHDLTREARQCPRCQRVYIVADPADALGAARRDPAPPDRYVPDRVERLLTAAKGVMAQFDAIAAHQQRLLVTGQDLESATANWDEATRGLSIDFSDLKTAIEACEKVPVPPAQAPTP